MSYIGLDLGTSAVKAVLVDAGQTILAAAQQPLATQTPQPLWSEQNPHDWWDAARAALAALRQAAPAPYAAARALGLSGQMHGAVLLDAADAVLRPAILWNDGRAHAQCAALEAAVPRLGEIAGVPAMPGFTAPKLLWLRAHEPDVFARVDCVLLPKDYLRLRLTGARLTDLSDAAGTLWLDEAARAWSPALVEACGLQLSAMPALAEGSAAAGRITPAAAAELGLPPTLLVAGGAGDAAAGALGVGAVEEGDAFLSLGTSGQYFVTTARYRPHPAAAIHAFAHALPERWYQMAAMLNGARCLAWTAELLGQPLEALLQAAEQAPGAAQDKGNGPALAFLPYLTGERTPHNDPHARGVLFGLTPQTTPGAVMRAVLEGVAYSFLDAQCCLAQAGTAPARLSAIGGGTRSPLFMQIMADVLGKPIDLHAEAAAGPAFGAARLAILAHTGAAPAAVCIRPPLHRTLEPDPARHAQHAQAHQRFRALYAAVKPHFAPAPEAS